MSDKMSLIFYIVMFSVSAAIFKLYTNKNRIVSKIGRILAISIPTFIAAFRYQVGTDYSNYDYLFTYIRNNSWEKVLSNTIKWETGFKILVKVLTEIGDNRFVFGALAFLTLAVITYTLRTDYGYYGMVLSYFVYLFFYFPAALNIVRQSLAVAIVFYSYKFIFENNKYKYFLFILLAASIHTSAIVALPVYYLWNHKKNKAISTRTALTVISISVCFVCMWRSILQIVLSFGWSFGRKFTYLLENNNGMNRDIFVKLIMLAVFITAFKKLRKLDERNAFFVYLFALNCIVSFTGYQITFFKRIGMYFEITLLVLVGWLPRIFTKSSKIIVQSAVIAAFLIYFYLGSYLLGHGDIIPYQWR